MRARFVKQYLIYTIKRGIVAEPAGALAVAGLEEIDMDFEGKRIAILLCGGNNDILRMPEISERALLYASLKHYFMIDFPQRAGALKVVCCRCTWSKRRHHLL